MLLWELLCILRHGLRLVWFAYEDLYWFSVDLILGHLERIELAAQILATSQWNISGDPSGLNCT